MTEVSYPLASYNGGAVTETEWSRNIGYPMPSGLIGSPDDASPVLISAGSAYLRLGTAGRVCGMAWEVQDADTPITIDANPAGSARLDHVVARLTWATMQVRAEVLKGTAGAGLPTLTQQRGTGVYEISLQQVSVPAGGTVATATLTSKAWYLGKDGQILCKAATRPPHEAGRRIREIDTGRVYESNGTNWVVLLDDAGNLSLTYPSGWVRSSGYGYATRLNGLATVQVSVQRDGGGLGAGGYQIATLPASIRPRSVIEVPVTVIDVNSATSAAHARLYPDGDVTALLFAAGMPANGFLVLAPATYPVA